MSIRTLGSLGLPVILALLLSAGPSGAYPSLYGSNCASCHEDDTPTCDGCHRHRGTLHASPDKDAYAPGEPVVVTLSGGTQGGWIRAILYDETNAELTRASGPTGTGDDGMGSPVVFPVDLTTSAPTELGDHLWEAAWYGNNGTGHLERRTTVAIRVAHPPADVPEEPPQVSRTWGGVRALYR